jgi:hypothetical protein
LTRKNAENINLNTTRESVIDGNLLNTTGRFSSLEMSADRSVVCANAPKGRQPITSRIKRVVDGEGFVQQAESAEENEMSRRKL